MNTCQIYRSSGARRFICGLSAFFLMAVFAGSLPAEPLKISFACEDVGIPPFIVGNGSDIDADKPGVSVELLKLLEDKLPVKISFSRMPWKRALIELENNRIDGIFHASFKPERMLLGVYPMKNGESDQGKQIATFSYILYKRRDSPLGWDGISLTDINGPIGVIMGYSIADDLRTMGAKISEAYTPFQNMKMLSIGRIAGVADLEESGDAVLKQYSEEFGNIVKMSPPLKQKCYYLMLSHKFVKENPELAPAIWNETEKIRKSETYKKLFDKYSNSF
jgi:polar amino acid transport system substrate-binding protein